MTAQKRSNRRRSDQHTYAIPRQGWPCHPGAPLRPGGYQGALGCPKTEEVIADALLAADDNALHLRPVNRHPNKSYLSNEIQ
jgi:hypothetical protein